MNAMHHPCWFECKGRECSSILRLSNSVYARWEYPASVLVRQEEPADSDEVVHCRRVRRPAAHFPVLYPGQREAWDQKKCPRQSAETPSTLGSLPTWALVSMRVTKRDTQTGAVSKSYLRTWNSRLVLNHSIPQTSGQLTRPFCNFFLENPSFSPHIGTCSIQMILPLLLVGCQNPFVRVVLSISHFSIYSIYIISKLSSVTY